MFVVKKDGRLEEFSEQKIIDAVNKSAERVLVQLTPDNHSNIVRIVRNYIMNIDANRADDSESKGKVDIRDMHRIVEIALDHTNRKVAKSYREYRNYKVDFVEIVDEVYRKSQSVMFRGDKSNSNTDSSLVTTKRSIIYGELNKELYNKFFLNSEERQACRDGYIYIHDKSSRRDSANCCLFDSKKVMTGGFEMGNLWYNEPKTIDVACDVLGDIIMNSASMQYGKVTTAV